MIEERLNLQTLSEAARKASESPKLVEAVRHSFHHLIADFWLAAMSQKKITMADESKAAGILAFWDHEIPKPTPASALAWLLSCESGETLFHDLPHRKSRMQKMVIPSSPHPRYMSLQWGLIDEGLEPSLKLPSVHDHRAIMNQSFYARLAQTGGDERRIQWINDEEHSATATAPVPSQETTLGWHFYQQQQVAIIVNRLAYMSDVLSPPKNPNAETGIVIRRGQYLRSWTRTGLWVKPPTDSSFQLPWQNGEPVRVADNSDLSMTHVPNGTPPLWLGFQTESEKGAEACIAWLDAYCSVRNHAISAFYDARLDQPLLPRPRPEHWDELLLGRIMGASTGSEGKSRQSKAMAKRAELAASLAGFKFDNFIN